MNTKDIRWLVCELNMYPRELEKAKEAEERRELLEQFCGMLDRSHKDTAETIKESVQEVKGFCPSL